MKELDEFDQGLNALINKNNIASVHEVFNKLTAPSHREKNACFTP